MTLTKRHPRHFPATPAMAAGVAAGVADRLWSPEEVCALLGSSRLLRVA